MLFASIAILTLLIGFAEGQGRLQNLPQSVPRNLPSSAASKNFQANPPSRSTSQVQSFSENLTRVVNYPNWETWKKQYGKSYSPSEERPAKHQYLMNVMYLLEQSFINFGHILGVNHRTDLNVFQLAKSMGKSFFAPDFYGDFLKIYKKKYSSPAEEAYRKKVFEQNVKVIPGSFYWSDWTPEEFNNLLPVNLMTYRNGNKTTKKLTRFTIENLRQQDKQGTDFNQTLKLIDINLLNSSQSLVELITATSPMQQLGSKARKLMPIQNIGRIQSYQKTSSPGSYQQASKTQNVRSQSATKSYQGLNSIPQSKASLPQRRFQNKAPTQLGSNLQNPDLIPKQYLSNQFDSQTKINTVPTIPKTQSPTTTGIQANYFKL